MANPKDDAEAQSPAELIDARIKEMGDWRGEMLARIRKLIKKADPEGVEEWKWRGVPTWYHDGMICTGETYTNVVKMTFAKGCRCRIPRVCSTPAWTETPDARLISTRATTSTGKAQTAVIRAAVKSNGS
jgi:hypothetical protein